MAGQGMSHQTGYKSRACIKSNRSAAALLLLLVAAWDGLDSVGVGGSLEIHSAFAVAVRGRDHSASQVLQVHLLGDLLVQIIDAGALLGGGLMEGGVYGLRVRLGRLDGDLGAVDPVGLGRHDADDDVLVIALVLQLVHPVGQTLETLLLRAVVAQAHCARILVVDRGQRSELLSTGRVPNLQLYLGRLHYALGLHVEDLRGVVGAEGRLSLRELILHVAVHDASFSHAGIPQHHHFVALLAA